jgi:hypothetical protein
MTLAASINIPVIAKPIHSGSRIRDIPPQNSETHGHFASSKAAISQWIPPKRARTAPASLSVELWRAKALAKIRKRTAP